MIAHATDLLIAGARCFINIGEQGKDNHGQIVEIFLKEVGLDPGQPWCAAFVHHVGYWSHFDYKTKKSSWPLPATGGCAVLGEFASAHKVLFETPKIGDVFLKYFPDHKRFAHTGVVIDVLPDGACVCIEGNTNDDGSRNGWMTLVKTRRFGAADRFIRWTAIA